MGGHVPSPQYVYFVALTFPDETASVASSSTWPHLACSRREAHVSISLLDERFRGLVGVAPIRYLTGWRMHLAKDLLRSSDLGIASIAQRVGCDSEEASSRASSAKRDWPPILGGTR